MSLTLCFSASQDAPRKTDAPHRDAIYPKHVSIHIHALDAKSMTQYARKNCGTIAKAIQGKTASSAANAHIARDVSTLDAARIEERDKCESVPADQREQRAQAAAEGPSTAWPPLFQNTTD
jgi:hypothetical protein